MWNEKKVSTHCWPCGLVGHSDLFLFVIFTFTGRYSISFHFLCLNRDWITVMLIWLWNLLMTVKLNFKNIVMPFESWGWLECPSCLFWPQSSGPRHCCHLKKNWEPTRFLQMLYNPGDVSRHYICTFLQYFNCTERKCRLSLNLTSQKI